MTSADLTAPDVRRRFLLLRGLRWLPTGLIIPIVVLLLLDRGLGLGEIGLVIAAQGATMIALELPTGGLADAVGRREVLLLAAAFDVAALSVLVLTETAAAAVAAFALMGVHRALESGPLDAWYVDAAQAADGDADIEGGLAAGGVVLGIAIAVGAVASSAVVALHPLPRVDPLVLPVAVALLLRLVEVVAVARLVREPARHAGLPVGAVLRTVPGVVGSAVRLVRARGALRTLVGIEVLWGAGMWAFEVLTPARLAQVTGSAEEAAALMGPSQAGAWALSAAGAAVVPALSRRLGAAPSGTVLLGVQAAAVIGIAVLGGPVGVVAAFGAVMLVHGAANPVHQGLLHRSVDGPEQRATVVSANSMAGALGGALGGVALGAAADATTLTTAGLAGAALVGLAATGYLRVRPAQVHIGGGPDGTGAHRRAQRSGEESRRHRR